MAVQFAVGFHSESEPCTTAFVKKHAMDKYERHHERIHRKWLRLKSGLRNCTCGGSVGLNESMLPRRFKRFYCECESCHWTSPKAMTIRGAVRMWNQDYLNTVKKGYV